MFPNPILQQVFSYLSLPDRLRASRVSRKWYYNCTDPYLYQDIVLKDLEFNTLLLAMQRIISIRPRIRSITIEGCYSHFIQTTMVPVQFSSSTHLQHRRPPLLFSHIKALQPARRRKEYFKHGFDLHNHFSNLFYQLLELGQDTLHTIKILNCSDLDFEMTELFCTMASHAHGLSTFYYINNGDQGLASSGLLQAIVLGCPKMRHFRGLHVGINDVVLMTMARHWPHLESLTLCSTKSKDVLEWTSRQDGHEFRAGTGTTASLPTTTTDTTTTTISSRAFWELLCKCKHLSTLELNDLACVTNHDLAMYNSLRDAITIKREKNGNSSLSRHVMMRPSSKYHPYYRPPLTTTIQQQEQYYIPGTSLRHLRITKYMTTPLSTPGFMDLTKLFPNLIRFEYATNFYTFHNQFEGMTLEMYKAERCAVTSLLSKNSNLLVYDGQWNEAITTEQRLMAGITSLSSSDQQSR